MQKRYCIVEYRRDGMHAGAKARNDAARIMQEEGWNPLAVRDLRRKSSLFDKVRMCPAVIADWARICSAIPRGSLLLVQYPLVMYPQVSRLALPFLDRLKRKKVRLIYLVHDLDSLRGINADVERAFLKRADELIVHTPRMREYLIRTGNGTKKYRLLGLFDYLTDVPERETDTETFGDPESRQKMTGKGASGNYTVVVAGNLSPEKAGFVYQLHSLPTGVSFNLYGPFYGKIEAANESAEHENCRYCGAFDPEILPQILKGDFGLVWDGDSVQTCAGDYGRYLRVNAPHKTSLYLAAGLPVIVWDQSALAEFVKKMDIGLAVSSLEELPVVLGGLDPGEYEKMRQKAAEIGEKLRTGGQLRKILP